MSTDTIAKPIVLDELSKFDQTCITLSNSFWEGGAPDEDPMPHVLIETHYGELHIHAISGEFMASGEAKDRLAKTMQYQILRQLGKRVAFLCGAWTVDSNGMSKAELAANVAAGGHHPDNLMPSEHPNKKEIAFIQVMEHGRDAFYTTDIERSTDKSPVLVEWKQYKDGQHAGRFHDEWMPALETAEMMYEAGIEVYNGDHDELKASIDRVFGQLGTPPGIGGIMPIDIDTTDS